MTTQKRILRAALEEANWEIEVVIDNLDWWADEVWIIRREKSVQPLYLTFIVDPMFDGVRKKGEQVESVTASHDEPCRTSTRILYLRRGWQKELLNFVQRIEEI